MSLSLVLATRNLHKVAELRRILADAGLADTGGTGGVRLVGIEAYPQVPDVVESGTTFAENALLKAHAVARGTGCAAVADDSGLCVDVLGGAPGVFSARWSGRHGDDRANLALLLAQLGDVADGRRGAHFACAAALATPDGAEHVVEGGLAGRIIRQARGSHGFGYDPIFVPAGHEGPPARTLAELGAAEKDRISHRGLAFRALVPLVRALLR